MFLIKIAKLYVIVNMFLSVVGIVTGLILLTVDHVVGGSVLGSSAILFFMTWIPYILITVCESVVNIDQMIQRIDRTLSKGVQYQCDRLLSIAKSLTEIKNG